VGAGVFTIVSRSQPATPTKMPPVVGRTETEQRLGMGPGRLTVPAHPSVPLPELEDVEAVLARAPWPSFARNVVLYPVPGDSPKSTLEEGPPFHFVLSVDGTLIPMRRFLEGRPAVPPGLPAREAGRAAHVLVPRAEGFLPPRRAALTALVHALGERLGPGRVILMDRLPGSTVQVPAGFPRELIEGR
jgi:hypothetical protein